MGLVIYKPKGPAAEYAHLALNIYDGCDHKCKYCYVPRLPNWRCRNFWTTPPTLRDDIIVKTQRDAHKYSGTNERVLLCFTCNPYPAVEIQNEATRKIINILSGNDIPFTVLTKSGTIAARDFELFGPRDQFGATLTFVNPADSRRVEPNAAIPRSRILGLEMAKKLKISTWVSLEPVVDPKQTLEIIRQTHAFVDHYKIGILNYAKSSFNFRTFGAAAIELLERYGKSYFIKDSLARYLYNLRYTNTDNRKTDIAAVGDRDLFGKDLKNDRQTKTGV